MYHNVLPFITYSPPLLLFTDFHLPPFYNWFLTIWDKKKYNYWMKTEIALLWIIFDLISSKLLMDLTLIIRKLSFTRISGPHEPIIDLSENRLVQSPCWSSQSTLQLWPPCYLKGYLFILFDYLTSNQTSFFIGLPYRIGKQLDAKKGCWSMKIFLVGCKRFSCFIFGKINIKKKQMHAHCTWLHKIDSLHASITAVIGFTECI